MQIRRMNDPSGISACIDIPVGKESYVQRILTENEIPGLCRLRIKNTDGDRRYCFQIGKMQSLPEAAERAACGRSVLRRVLKTLAETEEELENYLIEADCLLLEPELIFLADGEEVRFCACPGQHRQQEESLKKLITWFWEVSAADPGEDFSDGDPQDGLRKGQEPLSREQYEGLLALCEEPDPDLGKMCALLEDTKTEEAAPAESKEGQAALPGWVRKNRRKAEHRERRKKRLRIIERVGSLLMPLIGAGVELLLWKSGMLAAFSRWIQIGIYGLAALFFLMLTLLLRESENRRLISAEEALDLLPPPDEELPQILIEDTLEYDADQLEEAAVVLERGETVLLSELMIAGSALGILISRQPERRQNIYVTTSPFRIGKAGSGSDAEPESRYLSREHALIEATESGCKLRDEGSTNGTFVNGDRLIPGQWITLSDGDEVRFADAPYRYRQGCREN